jgi:hypothetical protein
MTEGHLFAFCAAAVIWMAGLVLVAWAGEPRR